MYMQFSKILTLTLCFPLLLANCKQDTKAPVSTPPSPTSSASEKTEVFLYVVETDNLLLRDQPSQKGSNVITKFSAGTFVTGTGETSTNKETATIRGMEMTEPYIKVFSTTPENQKGWAFGGALQVIYKGAKANSPDLGKLNQLTTFLNTLNVKKLDSGKKAWDYVKTNFGDANGSIADAALVLLEKFMRRMEFEGDYYKTVEQIKWEDADYDAVHGEKFDMNKYPQTKALADNGFRLETMEGSFFPIYDLQDFSQFFGTKVTPSMNAWLNQSLIEQRTNMSSDGGIVIPLDQVADRAVFWEKFNAENPNFVYSDEAKESEKWTQFCVTNGENNTPVFQNEEETVSPDFVALWKYILSKYPGTKVAKLAKDMTDMTTASKGKKNDAIRAYQEKAADDYMK